MLITWAIVNVAVPLIFEHVIETDTSETVVAVVWPLITCLLGELSAYLPVVPFMKVGNVFTTQRLLAH